MKDESRGVQLLLTGPSSEEHKSQIIWFPPSRRLTACVIAGCVGHAPVHSDSDPRAWGSGDHARCVEQQQHSDPRAWGSGDHARCVEQQHSEGLADLYEYFARRSARNDTRERTEYCFGSCTLHWSMPSQTRSRGKLRGRCRGGSPRSSPPNLSPLGLGKRING